MCKFRAASSKKAIRELLEPFKEAGENKGRQLLDTLETFVLDAGMNSSKTAEFMDFTPIPSSIVSEKINETEGDYRKPRDSGTDRGSGSEAA